MFTISRLFGNPTFYIALDYILFIPFITNFRCRIRIKFVNIRQCAPLYG